MKSIQSYNKHIASRGYTASILKGPNMPCLSKALGKLASQTPDKAHLLSKPYWRTIYIPRPHHICSCDHISEDDVRGWKLVEDYHRAITHEDYSREIFPIPIFSEDNHLHQLYKTLSPLSAPVAKLYKHTHGAIDTDTRVNTRIHLPNHHPDKKTITGNNTWHIDFQSIMDDHRLRSELYKPHEEFDSYICTLTDPGGPTTAVLNVDSISIPCLPIDDGDLEAELLHLYIQELIESGQLSYTFLQANSWYKLPRNAIHRGPQFSDGFTHDERVFLHITQSIQDIN